MVHNKGLPAWVEIIVKYENIWRHSHYCEWKHTSKDCHSLDCGFWMLSHTSERVMEHYGQLFTDMIWSGSCVLFLFRRQADNLLLYCFTAVFAVSCITAFPFWMPRFLNDHFLCGTKKTSNKQEHPQNSHYHVSSHWTYVSWKAMPPRIPNFNPRDSLNWYLFGPQL